VGEPVRKHDIAWAHQGWNDTEARGVAVCEQQGRLGSFERCEFYFERLKPLVGTANETRGTRSDAGKMGGVGARSAQVGMMG